MKQQGIVLLAGAAMAIAAFGETSVKLEQKAYLSLEEGGRARAMKEFRAAAEQRVAEAQKIYSKQKKEELDLDTEALTGDDDETLMPGASETGEQIKHDAEARHYLNTAIDFNYGAKPFQCDTWLAKAKGVTGVSKKAAGEIAAFEAQLAKERDPAEYDPPSPKSKADQAKKVDKIVALQEKIAAATREKRPASMLAGLWSELGLTAFTRFRPDLMAQAKEEIAKLKKHPGHYPGRWVPAIACYENLKTFPKSEQETATPKTLADLGVKEKHTVVVGELDWDAENATECVEAAIASGATTLVFEDKGSPWYVRSIVPRSNQRLVFKKGVKVLMDKVSRQTKDKSPMILLKDVKNVIIEGEGGPEDVWIGKFASRAERDKYSNDYGASGIDFSGAENCVVRNVTFGANSMDGCGFGGGAGPTRNVWLENVVLTDNYRQAMSVCDALGVYCRNVSFLNTYGGDPMCGIDFEPGFESYGVCDCYFYDCTFRDNTGGAMNWSAASLYPVTAHMKRCHFEKQNNWSQIVINALYGIYAGNNVHAPSKLVFEDCDMHVYTDTAPIRFENTSFFDVEIKNFKIKDIGCPDPKRKCWGNPPLLFCLGRDFGDRGRTFQLEKGGKVTVSGLEVEGFCKNGIVGFRDRIGTMSINGLSGTGTMNGKTYDLSQFHYDAPEVGVEPSPKFVAADYLPPARTTAENPEELPRAMGFTFTRAWYEPDPVYRVLYFKDGAWNVKRVQTCVREFGLKTEPVAYYCRGGLNSFKMYSLNREPYTVYFEVPAGEKGAMLKTVGGAATIKNEKGEVVHRFRGIWANDYATCKTASGKSEVWSITFETAATLRFFAPFNSIIAESAEFLPRRK